MQRVRCGGILARGSFYGTSVASTVIVSQVREYATRVEYRTFLHKCMKKPREPYYTGISLKKIKNKNKKNSCKRKFLFFYSHGQNLKNVEVRI